MDSQLIIARDRIGMLGGVSATLVRDRMLVHVLVALRGVQGQYDVRPRMCVCSTS